MVDNSSNQFELFVEETFQIRQFAIELMQRQTRAIVLTALSLDSSEFKLHTFEAWQSDRVQKGPMDLDFSNSSVWGNSYMYTDWGCSPLGSLNSLCSPCSLLPPNVQVHLWTPGQEAHDEDLRQPR